MKNFLIITNYYKDSEARLTNHIKEYIEKKGGSCSTFFSNGETPGEAAPHREDIPENTQGVLVLGGDGTLIRAAAALVNCPCWLPLPDCPLLEGKAVRQ